MFSFWKAPKIVLEMQIFLHIGVFQGQAGWSSEQPDLVKGTPTNGKGSWKWVIFKVSKQLYDLMK